MSLTERERPAGLAERLRRAGFEGVDVASDETYGERRKLVVWVDQ